MCTLRALHEKSLLSFSSVAWFHTHLVWAWVLNRTPSLWGTREPDTCSMVVRGNTEGLPPVTSPPSLPHVKLAPVNVVVISYKLYVAIQSFSIILTCDGWKERKCVSPLCDCLLLFLLSTLFCPTLPGHCCAISCNHLLFFHFQFGSCATVTMILLLLCMKPHSLTE